MSTNRLLYRASAILQKRYLYYQYNYKSKMEELVNCQILCEQQAAQEYLNIAVTFLHPSKSLIGAGGFFMRMYEEELQHMTEFIHYQIFRGGKPLIGGLQSPTENKNLTLLEAFNHSLAMEKQITKRIEECIELAEEVKDYQCADFLTSIFLLEQIQSIHAMSCHVTKLTKLGNNEHAVYNYDLELAKNYPYPYTTKFKNKWNL